MLPYGRQSIDEDDIAAVVEVLRSDFLTCGPKVEEFEQTFADYCGAKHAISCSNGTAALHLAMLAAEIGPEDRVVTSPITFLASANAARYVGATVDFCDIEPVAATLNADALEANWQPGTKAVVAVDYAGHAADHQRIAEICHSRGAILIEDASHSLGGTLWLADRPPTSDLRPPTSIGSLPWVDMTTFSFHPVKTMTTGEGGMVTTNDDHLADRLRRFRNHGIMRDPQSFQRFGQPGSLEESGLWAYEMQELGYNYRLTDIQCALGISQLHKLDQFVQRRAEIVAHYNTAFANIPHLTTPRLANWIQSPPTSDLRTPTTHSLRSDLRPPLSGARPPTLSWHIYPLRIDFKTLGKTRSEVMKKLRDHGIGTQVHYIPVHLQPNYANLGFTPGMFPKAEAFYQRCLSLPLFPSMTDDNVQSVMTKVEQIIL